MKTFYIIGVGGRTGAMFARELQDVCNVVGAGFSEEIEKIESQKIKIVRGGLAPEILRIKTVAPENFAAAVETMPPDFIWLATRNPVDKVVEFYYRHFAGKEKIPELILSQNGLSAIDDARKGLNAAMGHLSTSSGQEADKVKIVRVSLVNGIDLKTKDGTSIINYKLPVKLGFGLVGSNAAGGTEELKEIFQEAGVKAREFQASEILKMENSKLFLNLIGMAAAVEGVDAAAGWRDKKIFKKEIAMLGEFAAAVKKNGGGFVSGLGGYPVGIFAGMTLLPAGMLLPFRGLFANVVAKGRNRPKDLSEIDYYNGEVVRLGKEVGVATPMNEEIIRKTKEIFKG